MGKLLLPFIHNMASKVLEAARFQTSKDSTGIRRTRDPTRDLQGHTTQKEALPALVSTHLTQPLQIEHLPNRHSPARQQPLMQTPHPISVRPSFHWTALKTRTIARYGRKLVIPQEFQRGFAGLDADKVGRCTRGQSFLLAITDGVESSGEAGAKEEDITWAEDNILVCDEALEVREQDCG
jgi:hypothetical protein